MSTQLIYPKTVLSTLADGDRYYNLGNAAQLTDMEAVTIWAWVYIDAYGFTFGRIFSPGDNSMELAIDGGVGLDTARVFFEQVRSTFVARAQATPASQLSVGEWSFIAATYAREEAPTIYQGEIGEPIYEPAYTVQTVGEGTYTSTAANDKWLLSRSTGTNIRNLDGAVASVGIIGRKLSREELDSIRMKPRMVRNQLGYWVMGHDGNIGRVTDHSKYKTHGVLGGTDALTLVPSIPIPHEIPPLYPKPRFALADVPTDVRHAKVPRVPTKQPPVGTQLDLQHPVAKDLLFFCTMDRVGPQIDLVNNRIGSVVGGDYLQYRVPTPQGFVVRQEYFDGTTEIGFNFGNTGGSGAYDQTELTIIARVRFGDEADSGGSRIFSKRSVTGGADRYAIFLPPQQFANINFRAEGAGIDHDIIKSTGDWRNTFVDVAMALGGGIKNIYAWDLDVNDFYSTTDISIGEVVTDDGNLCLGHRDAEDRSFDGDTHWVAMFRGVKSLEFIEAFRNNPWQVFKPDEFFVPINESLPDVGIIERSW